MVFSSAVFLFAFLPLTLSGYYFLPRRFRNGFLTLMSLLFYAWGEPKFVLIMILSILMNYGFGLMVARRQEASWQKTILTLMVLANLSVFFVFKYLNFTIHHYLEQLHKSNDQPYLAEQERRRQEFLVPLTQIQH